jgi:hypothetical protein
VAGWSSYVNEKFKTYDLNDVMYDIDSCNTASRNKGADAFTLRLSNKSCIVFDDMPEGLTSSTIGAMTDVNEYVSGCVDQTKTWPACRRGITLNTGNTAGGQIGLK